MTPYAAWLDSRIPRFYLRVPGAIQRALFLSVICLPAIGQSSRDLVIRENERKAKMEQRHVPQGYALIIGISEYENLPGNDLKFPVSDAQAIYRSLISKEAGGFPPENVHLLLGRRATRENIRLEIEEWLPAIARPEDRVVVYFAGHGYVSRGKGYLAPWDTNLELLESTGYPMQTLGSILNNRVKAKWKALFIDACHSGKINSETTNEQVAGQINSAMEGTQFLSLSATRGQEKSYEDEQLGPGFGLFTYFVVKGIQGEADSDPCDGWVEAGELVDYVRREVARYAKSKGVTQTPQFGSDFDPAMILGRARNGCLLSSRTGSAEIEVNLTDTDVWVDDTLTGRVSPGKPLLVPGLTAGDHTVRGCKEGYECDLKKVVIAPGLTLGVSVRIRYQKRTNEAAAALAHRGETLLYSQRSTVNPVNMLPVRRSQSKSDLVEAKGLFSRALGIDSQYAQAAYHLGVVNQLLGDENGSIGAYRRAIAADPTNTPSRIHLAGVLMETGDADEAIRHLTAALHLEPNNAEAHSLLARAYLDKGAWLSCIDAAAEAIRVRPTQETAHLWRADCERQLAAKEKSTERFRSAAASYSTFLDLTNYATPAVQWFAYHFIGFHLGGQHHADRKASYELLRAAGFLGMCICEGKLGRELRAKEYCHRATQQDPADPIAHFLLGVAGLRVFHKTGGCRDLENSRRSFQKTLSLNSKLDEGRHARHYIEEIESRLSELRRKGRC